MINRGQVSPELFALGQKTPEDLFLKWANLALRCLRNRKREFYSTKQSNWISTFWFHLLLRPSCISLWIFLKLSKILKINCPFYLFLLRLFNFVCLFLSWLFALPERLVAWNNNHSALGPSISLEKKVTKALRREILFSLYLWHYHQHHWLLSAGQVTNTLKTLSPLILTSTL